MPFLRASFIHCLCSRLAGRLSNLAISVVCARASASMSCCNKYDLFIYLLFKFDMSFIHSSGTLDSFIPSFIHLFIYSFIHSSIPSFVPSFVRSFVCSFLRSFVTWFVCQEPIRWAPVCVRWLVRLRFILYCSFAFVVRFLFRSFIHL